MINEQGNQQAIYQFCIVKIINKMFSSKLTFEMDLGQEAEASTNYSAINNKTKQVCELNNLVDALNYLSALGWEIVNVNYHEFSGTTYNNPEYLLKRRI